ncbi:MAG: helix-turn-helix domain-containing protein [Oscillospiraceae bacterium]|jgi:DNA-binding XRE family transcriptional regulator|nr:helix-turn-helix domain-containing protein [Oscillospiraceae bacterium]MBP1591175.1 helix-turn-helix domain-containing protein [Oscillospiraceae bacterium]MBQ5337047.1 helix-turn-helix domain-containing protein [Oscillospiraceae bacterium]MBQ5989621.1 helix-turn-helix domain-containing protein [Oscillospiraceae bacterium]MBR3024970.1 helix-turn-helix domain-containing protein [Oscillospiraceae bacterium]
MNEKTKELLVDRMTENLVVLRAKLGITQAELADIAGMSRQTILAIEKKQRTMTWNTFLSLLFIFSVNKNTEALLKLFEILTDELIDYITVKK